MSASIQAPLGARWDPSSRNTWLSPGRCQGDSQVFREEGSHRAPSGAWIDADIAQIVAHTPTESNAGEAAYQRETGHHDAVWVDTIRSTETWARSMPALQRLPTFGCTLGRPLSAKISPS